jgi:hypothetical protein
MYHPIVKEQVIPGQLEGLQTNRHSTDPPSKCQALIPVENSATCGFLVTPAAQAIVPVPSDILCGPDTRIFGVLAVEYLPLNDTTRHRNGAISENLSW